MGDDTLKRSLEQLGLTNDEAKIFVSLVSSPKTLLEVSRITNIARSNVYRIADGLIKKSILHEITTDNGKLLASADPEALELLVLEQETAAKTLRANFDELIPFLNNFKSRDNDFAIKTYSGVSGIKQMLWNELRTEDEVLIFTRDSLDSLAGRRWAEKYRAEIIDRGIKQRSIENTPQRAEPLSSLEAYPQHYNARLISPEILEIQPEVTIHDDTVSLYNSWTDDVQLGTEIKNPFLATFMRQIFEHYWELSTAPSVDE